MTRKLLLSTLLMLAALTAMAQTISGTVVDAVTGEPLPFVNVFYSAQEKTVTNFQGRFALPLRQKKLNLYIVGYDRQTIVTRKEDDLLIRLKPADYTSLSEAVVTASKEKYSRKNNPAVELMRKVIAAAKRSDLKQKDYYSIEKYCKLTMSLNDVTDKVFEEGKFKRMPFLKEHVETSPETGKLILPISIEETVSQEIYRKSPQSEKSIITGKRSTGFQEFFSTGDLLTTTLNDCFTDVNIYEDDVRLLQYPFISPISNKNAIGFYRYYLQDTVMVDSVRAVRVDFTPNNSQDFGFSGQLYISVDSTYRIVKCDMGIPKRSDVNFVDNMRVIQEFRLLPTGEQVLTRDDMIVELKLAKFLTQFQVKRLTEYRNFSFDALPDKTFKFRGEQKVMADALMKTNEFWDQYRSDPLTESEGKMSELFARMSKIKGFKPILWIIKAFAENFVETTTDPKKGSKFDFGPVNTFLTHNFVEGFKMRVGGQTTANLSKHLFAKGYIAYGFKDHRVKGSAELTYSFFEKGYLPREFPKNNLTISYSNDVMSPSDRFLPTDKDNVFVSFKWTDVRHMMYYEQFTVSWDREWETNLRLFIQAKHEKDEPTAALFFQPLDLTGQPDITGQSRIKHIRTTDFTVGLTWSPGAKWINTKQRRYSPNRDFPVLSLQHTTGVKGIFGSDYNYNLTEASIYKRFWLHSWGKIDMQLKAGIQWNRVPFPLLIMPAANLSYIMEDNTFNLIDNMEFLNDRYVSLISSWDLNGKLFNRIPLLRRLKWREYIGVNTLWGYLSHKNNPFLAQNLGDSRLMYFPGQFVGSDGFNGVSQQFKYQSRPMAWKTPYVEIVVGIHNIFKLFHIEYVRRITYTSHLRESKRWGIRGMFRITF